MANNLTNLRTAIWSALDADATLTSLMARGTKIKWAGGLLKRMQIEPAACPILMFGPAKAQAPNIASGGHDSRSEWRYGLRFETHTEGQDCDEAEELVHRVIAVLAAEFPFELGASDGLYALDLEDVEFSVCPDPKTPKPIWSATFLAEARYRIVSP